jgi:transposase
LEAHREEILNGELKVFFQDECHLLWGDICGYVWGKTKQRITVPITNEREKQTYYGAIDLQTHELLVQPYKKGESQFTIAFLQYLQSQYPQSRIALIWDGASYHRSKEVKSYLDSVNQGLEPHLWKITCIRFAPNAPEQNPIEDVWLKAKRFVREFYSLCSSFAIAKRLFELATEHQIFDFPKLSLYGSFS